MNETPTDETKSDRSSSTGARLTFLFALAAVMFLALWAWTELRLRAEREITRSVEAEKTVLEGEARRSGLREQLRSRRTGTALADLVMARMSPADESVESKGRVYVDMGSGRVFGFFEGLDSSRPGMTYQLWFRPVSGPPESIGTVTFDDEGDAIITGSGFPADHVTGEFVLTLEQAAGALVPTGRDVLRGRLMGGGAQEPPGDEETAEPSES